MKILLFTIYLSVMTLGFLKIEQIDAFEVHDEVNQITSQVDSSILESFEYELDKGALEFEWEITEGNNLYSFHLQRRISNDKWKTVKEIRHDGKADKSERYQIEDIIPANYITNYNYRLKFFREGESLFSWILNIPAKVIEKNVELSLSEDGNYLSLKPDDTDDVMQFLLVNGEGNKIMQKQVQASEESGEAVIYLSGLDKGEYAMRLKVADGYIMKRIIK